jgi:hypothetical protein
LQGVQFILQSGDNLFVQLSTQNVNDGSVLVLLDPHQLRFRLAQSHRDALEVQPAEFLGREALLRAGREGALPVAGADEVAPAERQRVLPLPLDERRMHGVGGPEELEDVCLLYQLPEVLGPLLAGTQAGVLLDVLVA